MEKLKILHVYKSFNVFNGLVEILTIMAQDIDHERFELGVCVNEYDPSPFGEKFERLGGHIHSLNTGRGWFAELSAFVKLVRFLKRHRPDVVQTHVLKANLVGVLAAKIAGVPVVIATEMTLKDTAPTTGKRIRDRLLHPIATRLINSCDKFVVTGQFIRNEWARDIDPGRCEVIYPPFNLEKMQAALRAPRKLAPNAAKNIGFVGRLSEEKAVHTLLAAFVQVRERVQNSILTIVGTGPLEQELKACASRLGMAEHIHFTGYLPNSFEALKQFDLFVLPSRTEGCPIVILEAMAVGLPVVATRIGGNPELVSDGESGLLVPANDPAAMADAIVKILSEESLAKQMGEKAREHALDCFHPNLFMRHLQGLYLKLYEQKTGKAWPSDHKSKPSGERAMASAAGVSGHNPPSRKIE
jgi:glycosyltransferase involved in cell wall biosynthesis